MRKYAVLLALLLAACGGPLTTKQGTSCVRNCDITGSDMICKGRDGKVFRAEPPATYDTAWTPYSCRCHFHFPAS